MTKSDFTAETDARPNEFRGRQVISRELLRMGWLLFLFSTLMCIVYSGPGGWGLYYALNVWFILGVPHHAGLVLATFGATRRLRRWRTIWIFRWLSLLAAEGWALIVLALAKPDAGDLAPAAWVTIIALLIGSVSIVAAAWVRPNVYEEARRGAFEVVREDACT